MNETVQAISQVGFPIVITLILLWNYFKYVVAQQVQMAKVVEELQDIKSNQAEILKRQDKIIELLNERRT